MAVPLADAIALAKTANGSRPLEIRLLRRAETQETSYSVDLGSTGSALRWPGSEKNRLTIRGQVDRSGSLPRALTIILGKGSLRQIMCEPRGVDLCAASPPEGPMDRRQDLLITLPALPRNWRRKHEIHIPLRMNCLLFWRAAFVEIADVGFRDCWLAAVGTYASSNIALRGTVIEGSLTVSWPSRGKVSPRAPIRSRLSGMFGDKVRRRTARPPRVVTSTTTGLAQ